MSRLLVRAERTTISSTSQPKTQLARGLEAKGYRSGLFPDWSIVIALGRNYVKAGPRLPTKAGSWKEDKKGIVAVQQTGQYDHLSRNYVKAVQVFPQKLAVNSDTYHT